jgi:7-cyano-7-deazaguanine synthase
MKPLVLFSGGIDSTLVLETTRDEDPPGLAVTFDYGQTHKIEIEYASNLAKTLGFEHQIHKLPAAPKINEVVFAGRNLMFIAAAIPIAVVNGRDTILIGSNYSDFENFADCRPEFVRRVNDVMKLGGYPVTVYAPLLTLTKTQVVKLARQPEFNIPIDSTWSCYDPRDKNPCGECLACKTRESAGA